MPGGDRGTPQRENARRCNGQSPYWGQSLRAGVAVTGALLDATGSWSYALFAPSIALFVTGISVFAAFGSSDLQDFDTRNEPFWCARAAPAPFPRVGVTVRVHCTVRCGKLLGEVARDKCADMHATLLCAGLRSG